MVFFEVADPCRGAWAVDGQIPEECNEKQPFIEEASSCRIGAIGGRQKPQRRPRSAASGRPPTASAPTKAFVGSRLHRDELLASSCVVLGYTRQPRSHHGWRIIASTFAEFEDRVLRLADCCTASA